MLAVIVLALSSCSSCGRRVTPPQAGKLTIRFLDVGQGDSELIQLPNGHAILIDSGDRGAPTVGLLRRYGVGAVDLVVATHPHSDHIGEMRDVLREFRVAEFWDSGFVNSTRTYTDMLQEIKARGVLLQSPKRGVTRTFGDVSLEVLNPGPAFIDDSPNNASLVVLMTYGAKRFLFTGDAELDAWSEMVTADAGKLRADLLKAAHHGSSNGSSADILDAVRPSIVTISCAAGNDYHYPHPRVVRLLDQRRNAIALYRTDIEGTITAVCDGNTIEMSSEKQAAGGLYLTGDQAAGNVPDAGRKGERRSSRRSR